MFNYRSDIGYCLSQVIRDYGVNLEPDICLLLSNPLWLGLSVTEGNAYSPVTSYLISYLNPQVLENFTVNANCLFLPVRGDNADHLSYLETRTARGKKTLIKVSEHIFEMNEDLLSVPHNILLAVVDQVYLNPETGLPTLSLSFSADGSLVLPVEEFVRYWQFDNAMHLNSEWFTLIPSQTRMSEELLQVKLRAALMRQFCNLGTSEGKLLKGTAVLEFLKNELKKDRSDNGFQNQYLRLWANATGIVSIRERYASALNKVSFLAPRLTQDLADSLYTSAEKWRNFFFDIKTSPYSVQRMIRHYDKLIASENDLTSVFKTAITAQS